MSKDLPPKGLIISTYLHDDWRGLEQRFIDTICAKYNSVDGIVALRVEGAENIRVARALWTKTVVGLIKDDKFSNYITPTYNHYSQCIDNGADFVAVDFRYQRNVAWTRGYADNIWIDVDTSDNIVQYVEDNGFRVVSSTFCKNHEAFLSRSYPPKFLENYVNIEGGIKSSFHADRYLFDYGVRYVTFGRYIHNPTTILDHYLKEIW